MINSKKKGKRGEADLAKVLEAWWGGNFCRTPDSGAFMTINTASLLNSGNNISGDLICPKDFPFCVEAKLRREIDLFQLLRTNSQDAKDTDHPFSWVEQCKRDADRGSKRVLVCFRENRKQWYCIIDSSLGKAIKQNTDNFIQYKEYYIIQLKDLLSVEKQRLLDYVRIEG